MFQPLYRLLTQRPELIAEHADAYVDLAAAQSREVADHWKSRGVHLALLVVGAMLAITFGGVALMLWALLPEAAVPARAWVLWVVPVVPLALSIGGWFGLRRPGPTGPLALLREQWRRDATLLSKGNA